MRSYLSNQERTAGFLQAFQEEGLSIPPELILETGSWLYDAAEKVCLNFFNTYTGEMPTALFAFMTVWQLEPSMPSAKPGSYCT